MVGQVKAVDGVCFSVNRGETVAIVGEIGLRASPPPGATIIRLEEPTGGEVIFRHPRAGPGAPRGADTKTMDRSVREMQFIFQDPMASLDSADDRRRGSIAEPLVINKVLKGQALRDRVAELLTIVGLRPEHASALPARVLRRAAAAHRHRPRAGARPGPDHLRRAGVGAGRVGAGPGASTCWRTCRSDSG